MNTKEHPQLPYLSQEDRLEVYQFIIAGCTHLWSKNKLQDEKVMPILSNLFLLGQDDPYFLAHLTAWASKQDSKDLQVVTAYINSLSSADGQLFGAKSKYKKPNLRHVSATLLQELDPKMASRVYKLASIKWGVEDKLRQAYHYPTSLETAFKKYLKYRENNLHIVKGISKAGLGRVYKNLYRMTHTRPSDEVAGILRWQQKDRKIKFAVPEVDFKDKTDLQIAKEIRKKKIGYFGTLEGLSRIKKKMSPVIAVAILEQITGNQAVILRSMFEEQGVLSDPKVMKLYEEKISEAKTALDRAETVSKTASEEVKQALKKARSTKRKEQLGDVGKIFLHIDYSPSMEGAVEYAKENGAIIAEMVKDPKKNFEWGKFDENAEVFPIPETFEKEAFKAIMFGKRLGGGTDCFALYPKAREAGAEVDIFISDGEHNIPEEDGMGLARKMERWHVNNPDVTKPKAIVLIRVKGNGPSAGSPDAIKNACEANGIPYAEMQPETLHDSALVTQAFKRAVEGPMAVIEEIMKTKLPEYPKWWFTV